MGRPQTYTIDGVEKQAFLDWLCTPPKDRELKTMQAFADQLGVERRRLTEWKTTDKEFMEAWEKRYLATIGNPGRKQEIMDNLFRTATDPDDPKHVQAARTYFEIDGSLKPARMEVNVTRDTKDLSLEQIEELLAVKAANELEARRLRVVGDDE